MPPERNTRSTVLVPEPLVCGLLHLSEFPLRAGVAAFSRAMLSNMWRQGTERTITVDHPEVMISVRCDLHPWMQGYFVVLRTSHFAVTGEDCRFSLPNLPPGHYVITAWHEMYGTQSKEINITGESQSLDFSFTAKP